MSLPFVPRPPVRTSDEGRPDAVKSSPFSRIAAKSAGGLRKKSVFTDMVSNAAVTMPDPAEADVQEHAFNIRSVDDNEPDVAHDTGEGESAASVTQKRTLTDSPFARLFGYNSLERQEAPVHNEQDTPDREESKPEVPAKDASGSENEKPHPDPVSVAELGAAIDALYKGDPDAAERSYIGTKHLDESPFAGVMERSSMPHVKQLYMDLRGMKTLTKIAGAVIERPGSNAPDQEKINAVLRILDAARDAGMELAQVVTSARNEKVNAWAVSIGVDAVTSVIVDRWKEFKDERVDDVIELVRGWVEQSVEKPDLFEKSIESLNSIASKPRIAPDDIPHDRLRLSLRVAYVRFLEVYGVEAKSLPREDVDELLRGCVRIAANAAVRIDDRELAITYFQAGLNRAVGLAAAEYRRAKRLSDAAHPASDKARISLADIIALVQQDTDAIESSVESTLRSFEKREFHAKQIQRESR